MTEADDPVLDTRRLIARTSTATSPFTGNAGILSAKPKKEQDRAAKPRIAVLFLYDESLGQNALALRNAYYAGAKEVPIRTWRDLVRVLSRYSEIGTLVIDTHSRPGELLIGPSNKTPEDPARLLASTGVTVTDRIAFEGCQIMGDPVRVAKLVAGIAGPKARATGFTYFSIVRALELLLTGEESAATIEISLQDYDLGYLLPGAPSFESLAGKTGTVPLYRQWFRLDTKTTIPEEESNPRAIKRRSELDAVTVRTRAEAEEVRSDHAKPIKPARVVTIENIADVATP